MEDTPQKIFTISHGVGLSCFSDELKTSVETPSTRQGLVVEILQELYTLL